MKKWIFICWLLPALASEAQDKTVKELQAQASKNIKKEAADTSQKAWKKGGTYSFTLAQGSLNNWAAGGDDFSLAINTMLSTYAFYKKEKHSWDNTMDLNFGYINTTSLGSRKNDDRLDILSKYGYAIAPKWNVSGLVNFKTQFAKGYTYKNDKKTLASAFFSPAYILLSAGLDYKPNDHFSVFMSPATARWIVVKNDSLAAKGAYGVHPGKHSILEFGAFVTAQYLKEFNKTITYKSRLDLFSNYLHNPQNIDVFLSNMLSAKISKIISATWNVDLIYDDDVRLFGKNNNSPALGIKSMVGIGLLITF
ncbi:MAG: DUF3078 domain-containing protein [Chitinophagaceae bacterium]